MNFLIECVQHFVFEVVADQVLPNLLGRLGASIAYISSAGQTHWECDDWKSITLGGFVIVAVGSGVLWYYFG